MSVRIRRFLACSAAICWLAAIAIAAAAPLGAASCLFVLLLATAVALTNGACIGAAFTPLLASHLLGCLASARSGTDEGAKGKHHKDHNSSDGNGRVIYLRRLMRCGPRFGVI